MFYRTKTTTEYTSASIELVNEEEGVSEDIELDFEFKGVFKTDDTYLEPGECSFSHAFLITGFQKLLTMLRNGWESPECGHDYKAIIEMAEKKAWAKFEFDS